MKEQKKSNKCLIITTIVLVILLLGVSTYTVYTYMENQKLNNKYNVLETKYNKQKETLKEQLQTNKDIIESEQTNFLNYYNETNDGINIYGIGYLISVYSYKGNLYLATTKDLDENGNTAFENVFQNDNPAKSNEYSKVVNLNIKEKDIYRVVITHDVQTSDASQIIHFIYKDGKVDRYKTSNAKLVPVFKDYKVKNISISCNDSNDLPYCLEVIYTLTLQDGTTKTVTEK